MFKFLVVQSETGSQLTPSEQLRVPFDMGWVTEGIKCKISKTLALHKTELAGISEQGK